MLSIAVKCPGFKFGSLRAISRTCFSHLGQQTDTAKPVGYSNREAVVSFRPVDLAVAAPVQFHSCSAIDSRHKESPESASTWDTGLLGSLDTMPIYGFLRTSHNPKSGPLRIVRRLKSLEWKTNGCHLAWSKNPCQAQSVASR